MIRPVLVIAGLLTVTPATAPDTGLLVSFGKAEVLTNAGQSQRSVTVRQGSVGCDTPDTFRSLRDMDPDESKPYLGSLFRARRCRVFSRGARVVVEQTRDELVCLRDISPAENWCVPDARGGRICPTITPWWRDSCQWTDATILY